LLLEASASLIAKPGLPPKNVPDKTIQITGMKLASHPVNQTRTRMTLRDSPENAVELVSQPGV
jgi:hypothetical protein